MADKKISALTGATTPLAGTEVLPIVQGGSTVKVSIADVTAGRAPSMSGATLRNTAPVLNFVTTAGEDITGYISNAIDVGTGGKLIFGTKRNGNTTLDRVSINAAGDMSLLTSNLVIGTAGKGIAYPNSGGGSALAPAFSAYKNANQAIAAYTPTKIEFQTEDFDTNTNYDASTGRFTPTVAGYYQVNWCLLLNDTTNSYYTYLYKNGSSFRAGTNTIAPFPSPGQTTQLVGATLVYLNGSTDFIEIYVTATGAGQIDSSAVSSFFQACMVRGS